MNDLTASRRTCSTFPSRTRCARKTLSSNAGPFVESHVMSQGELSSAGLASPQLLADRRRGKSIASRTRPRMEGESCMSLEGLQARTARAVEAAIFAAKNPR